MDSNQAFKRLPGQIVQYKMSTTKMSTTKRSTTKRSSTKRSTRQMVQGKNVHETNSPRRKCPLDKSSTNLRMQLMLVSLTFN
ncbi:hypothetical protein M513_12479 [Trichuris suis]|uniref:Uncharacterized protein n=1 Tax=Trichuris suis TaxID=68888 RepID=A0A085LNS8_9BILA|nr:hypothetical protein M513_12479 [Trichuris suis]